MSVSPSREVSAVDPSVTSRVADFLFHEADLLDERRFDEWLALFCDELVYWLPLSDREDPDRAVSIIYDDRARLTERVRRLERGVAPSVQPPARTSHLVGNVRVVAEDGGLRATSRCLVAELRVNREQLYAATVEHALVEVAGELRIRRKVVRLVRRDTPLGNLTFLY